METIKIPFTGINRSIDEGISTDGQCMELINARIKNGSVEPIGNLVLIHELTNTEKVFYHTLTKKILVLKTDGRIEVLNEDYSHFEWLSSDLTGKVNDIAFLGNIACCITDTQILYEIFENNVDGYKYVDSIPEIPQIKISQMAKATSICPDSQFLSGRKYGTLTSEEFMRTADYNAVGYLDNCIDTLNKEEYMVGPCLLKYAFRTSSGEYIKESPIFLVEHGNKKDYTFDFKAGGRDSYSTEVSFYQISPFYYCHNEPNNATFKDYTYEFGAMGTKIDFSFDDFDLSYLTPLVVSIDVFISPIDWFEKKESKYGSITYNQYQRTDNETEQILKAYRFYKVAEFSLKGKQTWRLDEWSKDNISIQEQLITSETKHSFSAQTSYVYNSRLHLANINYSYFKGYIYGYESQTQESNTEYTLTICTAISTEQGETIVKNTISSKQLIIPFLTYPDSRAHTMSLFITPKSDSGVTGETLKKVFSLQKHPYLDIAYYCQPAQRWGKIPGDRSSYGLILSSYYIPIDQKLESDIPAEENTNYTARNALKVSALNSPMVFPASQTYQPTNTEIVGLCSNTTALSQGQFGQHPLYVFATDGVYAMSVGTGNVVYSTQTPITRDVCINPQSIKGIDQAVIFASKRGLMMIAGNTAKSISDDMIGYLPSCVTSSPIISKIAAIGPFALSLVEFTQYLENAEVGYNYPENELIIANKDYPYAYLFNMESSTWSKISCCIKNFTNKYPECYALIDSESVTPGVYDMQNSHRSISNILLLTKPIKMGTNAHKRILQTALRGIVKRAMSDLYLRGEPVIFRDESLNIFSDVGLYILGSNDAEHFTLISGKESIVDIRDLVTKMNKSKAFKYFMVALSGGVRTDVSLNYMEFIASEAFENRLR